MKRIVNILILFSGILFIYIVVSGLIPFECLFKKLFDIRCPGCGLTRSFRDIINLNFGSAIKYNILGIPLFIIIFGLSIGLSIDIILNTNETLKYINNFFKKNYIIIIFILIITVIINNINGI